MKKTALSILVLFVLCGWMFSDNQSVTFTSPAGGENWRLGVTQTIAYRFLTTSREHSVQLFKDGVFVGDIVVHGFPVVYEAKDYTQPWEVGKIIGPPGDQWALPGSGYTIKITPEDIGPRGQSNPFSIVLANYFGQIREIQFSKPPDFGGCPECAILNLQELRQKLVKFVEPVEAGLYLKGKLVANLGQIGKGKGFAEKPQVQFTPEGFNGLQKKDQFELRITGPRGQLIYSQMLTLVPSGK